MMHKIFIAILISLQGIACITALFSWQKVKHSFWKYFTFYLAFIFLSEMFGLFCLLNEWKEINQSYMSFIVIPTEFIFFYLLFAHHAFSKNGKYLSYGSVALYLLSVALENLLAKDFDFFSISYTVGNLLLLIIIFMYLYQYLQSDELLLIKGNPVIYLSVGLLIFYIGSFPFYLLKNYLWAHFKVTGNYYWYFAIILNCLMYCMFTTSFIWGKFKSISSSS